MEYEISIRYKLKGVQTIIYKTVIEDFNKNVNSSTLIL